MKNSTKTRIRTTSLILSLAFIFTLLWSLSFQSFASETPTPDNEPKNPVAQADEVLVSAFAVNPESNENFDATEGSPAMPTVHSGESSTFAVNFHCKLPTAPETDLNYHLFAIQADGAIYLNYEDDLGNSFSPGFIFVSDKKDRRVELCIDEDSEILLDDQKMTLDFWKKMTGSGGYDGLIKAGNSSINLVFTVKATVNDEAQTDASDTGSSSDEVSTEITDGDTNGNKWLETPEGKDIDLVDLTNDDVILDLIFSQKSDKANRAEIEESQTETIIKLSNSANFTLRARYYALPEFCNPLDCNTHIETTDDGFTIYFETALGEIRSHTYKFQPSSDEVKGVTLSYNVSTSGYQLNVSNPFGGLSAEDCLFGKRGISDQVCYKAASIKVEITAKVTQPIANPSTDLSISQIIDKNGISNATNTDPDETSTESSTKRSGISIFIPAWLIGMLNFLLKIVILALVYFAGKKQLIESHIIPKITNFLKDSSPS